MENARLIRNPRALKLESSCAYLAVGCFFFLTGDGELSDPEEDPDEELEPDDEPLPQSELLLRELPVFQSVPRIRLIPKFTFSP